MIEEVSLAGCVIEKEEVPLIFYIMHVLVGKREFISNVAIVAYNFFQCLYILSLNNTSIFFVNL